MLLENPRASQAIERAAIAGLPREVESQANHQAFGFHPLRNETLQCRGFAILADAAGKHGGQGNNQIYTVNHCYI
ncbi:hypothetical protein [Oleiagrimonas sp.]|jgi:hypothetical protein|uniref:hypothetical protein n=1 Tax=Oleiagrimonas sp. TaxID=2010330 RepID=UPI00263A216B|nr:hypothetical protein [Oleiagrimonas sp.]MDA3913077.1 hypothetical protein [Oleiagrimonas sp.]